MTAAPVDAPAARATPLLPLHQELGGKLVDFAGWSLPVQYPAGIAAEHRQCRERAALFDVSHMGQLVLRGPDVASRLERLVPSGIASLAPGRARYTVFTNADGGVLDDLIVTNAGDHLFLVVNASMRAQDLAHLRAGLPEIEVIELADQALLAVQGPAAAAVLQPLAPAAAALRFMTSSTMAVAGIDCRVARLGYTGEDGFEISCPAAAAVDLARRLLADPKVAPAGLGARDSLRLEAGLCLYGHELDPLTSPIEAELGWIVPAARQARGDFPGAARILAELRDGPARRLVGLRPEGRALARDGTEIRTTAGEVTGKVTSGGFGPTIDGPVSLGYVRAADAAPGTALDLVVRDKARPAQVVPLPFVPHRYRR